MITGVPRATTARRQRRAPDRTGRDPTGGSHVQTDGHRVRRVCVLRGAEDADPGHDARGPGAAETGGDSLPRGGPSPSNYQASDHTLTDQASILRFIEDNWNLGRIGADSFDQLAGSLANMFDFNHPRDDTLFLDPVTGERPNEADDD